MIRSAPIRSLRLCSSGHQSFSTRAHRFISASSQTDTDETDPSLKKRRVLSAGRSRRKLEARRRDQQFASSCKQMEETADQKQVQATAAPQSETKQDEYINECAIREPIPPTNDNWHILRIMEARPMTNPIRQAYLESQIEWKFPRTIEGWRICIRRAWNTYLFLWEGSFLSEKIRDKDGNIIGVKKVDEDEEEDDMKETMKEKATDTATQIAQNVQKNVATIQHEAPKLLVSAQKLTGISTKEELKQWATEQLKLGTECLSMFMKGYRQGRDDEVDKMLHEYFNDIDEEKQDDAAKEQMSTDEKTETEKRQWGRKARRKKRKEKLESTDETAETAA